MSNFFNRLFTKKDTLEDVVDIILKSQKTEGKALIQLAKVSDLLNKQVLSLHERIKTLEGK